MTITRIFSWNEDIPFDTIDEVVESLRSTLYTLYKDEDNDYPDINEKTHRIAMDVELFWEEI